MKEHVLGYRCSLCGEDYGLEEVQYTCPKDGGNLDVILDYEYLRKHYRPEDILGSRVESLWRYLPLLPVDDAGGEHTPLRSAGWTPTYAPPLLRREMDMPALWVKDESRNPTASFKDRASAIVVSRAQETGADVIVTASTGNAGAALAGMSAAIGQKAVIFAPRTAPPAKVAQLLVFGAKVLLVNGTYDHAFDLSCEAADEFGWYCRNTGYNPFSAEGKKTAALEIWEMLTRMEIRAAQQPMNVFVSVGDGNIISGIHKGFKDLLALGWIEQTPRIFGVQAEGSAAIANAFFAGAETIQPVHADTIADSISVDLPRDGVRAVRAAAQTGGSYVVVTDVDILNAITDLGRAGIFAEPAGAAAYAGLAKALEQGLVERTSPTIVINTGSGLKDIRAAMQAAGEAPVIEPTLEDVRKTMDTWE